MTTATDTGATTALLIVTCVPAISAMVVPGWLLVLVGIDLRDRILPNRLTVPAALAALAMASTDVQVGLAIIALATPYLVACLAGGCGGGDVKLAVALGGLVADPWRALVIVLAAALLGLGAAAATGVARRDTSASRPLAHGPALVVAALSCGGLV